MVKVNTIDNFVVPATVGIAYTVPALTTSVVQKLCFTNKDNIAHALNVYKVPLSGSPGTGNIIVFSYSIPVGAIFELTEMEGIALKAGATLQMLIDSGSLVLCNATIMEIS